MEDNTQEEAMSTKTQSGEKSFEDKILGPPRQKSLEDETSGPARGKRQALRRKGEDERGR